jgi:Protein of unknown function (DUF3098).
MDKKKFAFTKTNYILVAVGMAVIIIGLLLMTGANSTEEQFVEDIFSVRRIKVSPIVTLIGFLTIIAAIMYKPKQEKTEDHV